MNIPKLEGIVDAIEEESRTPSPSHQNLARLVAMFMREILVEDEVPLVPQTETQTETASSVGEGASAIVTIVGETPAEEPATQS